MGRMVDSILLVRGFVCVSVLVILSTAKANLLIHVKLQIEDTQMYCAWPPVGQVGDFYFLPDKTLASMPKYFMLWHHCANGFI